MTRLRLFFPVTLLLVACQGTPPAIVGETLPVVSPRPLPSPSPSLDWPWSAGMVPISVVDTPGGIPDATLPVGGTKRLRAGQPWEPPPPGPVTWKLDGDAAARATLAVGADGTCTVTATAPGPIAVLAELGAARGRALLAAIATPAPGRPLDLSEGSSLPRLDGAWILRSAAEWTAYQEASRQALEGCATCALPTPPPVDWASESVVLIGRTFPSTSGLPPVLADVAPDRVVAVLPEVPDMRLGGAAMTHIQRAWAVPRLAADARVSYTCTEPCGPAGSPLPRPDPFAFLRGQELAVGTAIDLPAGWAGDPLTWTIAPRDAARARLDGRRLTPLAPGPLALTARAGNQEARLLHAIRPAASGPRLVTWHPVSLAAPRVAADAAAWKVLWESWYAAANPTEPGAPTAPPPAPPAPGLPDAAQPHLPAIAFPAEAVVAIPAAIDVRRWPYRFPVVTHLEGGTVHLVLPAARAGDRELDPPPALRNGAGDLGPPSGPQAVVIALPAADAPTVKKVVLDGFPD